MVKYFKSIILSLLVAVGAVGCYSSSSPTPQALEQFVQITKSTTLDRDYKNVSFLISGSDIVFDMNGHTIQNYTKSNSVVVRPQSSAVTIKNGHIESNGIGGGIHIAGCISPPEFPALLAEGQDYANKLYAKCTKDVTVRDMSFSRNITGVFVGYYVTNVKVLNSSFYDNERMAIYLDSGSKDHLITGNKFFDNGFRENGGKRRRGHISVDGTTGAVIAGNTFTDSRYKKAYSDLVSVLGKNYSVPAIEFYKNCGEVPTDGRDNNEVLPRIHGANYNKVYGNTFTGVSLAAWLKYREHDQVCSVVIYPDEANYNELYDNTLIRSGGYVQDDGVGNIIR